MNINYFELLYEIEEGRKREREREREKFPTFEFQLY